MKDVDISGLVENETSNIELLRILLTEKFLPSSHRDKTQITKNERVLLSVVESFSEYIKKYDNYAGKIIDTLIKAYSEYGISIDRKGRKEVVKILESLHKSDVGEETEKTVREFLLK